MQQNGMSGRLNLPIVTEPFFSALDMVLFPGLERSVVCSTIAGVSRPGRRAEMALKIR